LNINKIICLFGISMAIAAPSFAEVIILKNGQKIEAPIIEKTGRNVIVDFLGVPLTYYFDEIQSIDGNDPGQNVICEGKACDNTLNTINERYIYLSGFGIKKIKMVVNDDVISKKIAALYNISKPGINIEFDGSANKTKVTFLDSALLDAKITDKEKKKLVDMSNRLTLFWLENTMKFYYFQDIIHKTDFKQILFRKDKENIVFEGITNLGHKVIMTFDKSNRMLSRIIGWKDNKVTTRYETLYILDNNKYLLSELAVYTDNKLAGRFKYKYREIGNIPFPSETEFTHPSRNVYNIKCESIKLEK